MTIGFNKFQFYAKIIILTIVLSILGLFIYYRPPIKFDNAPIGGIIFLIIIWTLLILFLVLMTLQLFLLPNGVEIDDQNKILTLKIFCAKPLIILPNDINEFCSIVVKIKSTDYEGVLMRFKNGKECVVGDFNLENFRPIQTFLEETKVSFVGHYKFSFASYFFRHFRQ